MQIFDAPFLEVAVTQLAEYYQGMKDGRRPSWESLKTLLSGFKGHCGDYGLAVTNDLTGQLIDYLDTPDANGRDAQMSIEELLRVLHVELRANVFLHIPQDRKRYFEAVDFFGEEVSARFSSATADIAEAGRCFALDRYPACIFHLMRVAERALRVMANELAVPLASLNKGRSWGGVIFDISEKLREMPDEAPKKARLREPMHFLTEVKDLWRDKGIHPVEDFSPQRTERVYNAIRSFMQTCVEKGIVEPDEESE